MRDALETVYRAFAAPTPRVIDGCPCCIDTRNVDALLATPLRALSGDALWRYVSGAFLTVGGVRDFRYLLPRILEVAVDDTEASNGPEIVLGKLRLAGWNGWPADERRVIEDVIDSWFDLALARDLAELAGGWLSASEAESVLCGAARAGLPLQRWLKRLREPGAASVLAQIVDRLPDRPRDFWTDAPQGFEEMSRAIGGR